MLQQSSSKLLDDIDRIKDELSTIKERLESISVMSHQKPILNNDDLMDLLGVSRSTLQNYRNQGRIAYSKSNGTIWYQYTDILVFLEKHKHNSFS